MLSGVLSGFFKITMVMILITFLLNSWDEVVERAVFNFLGLDPDALSSWLLIAIITTLILMLVLRTFKLEAHELFGLSELVDRILTGTRERLTKSGIKHIKIK